MARSGSIVKQRRSWLVLVALAAALFWVAGALGGARGWLKTESDLGPVAHLQEFGEAATVWFVPAAVLTLVVVVMGIGIALVRHLVDGPVELRESLPEPEHPQLSPRPELDAAAPAPSAAPEQDDDVATAVEPTGP